MTERIGQILDIGMWLWNVSTPGTSVLHADDGKWKAMYENKPVVDVSTKEPIFWLTRDGAVVHVIRLLRADGKFHSL